MNEIEKLYKEIGVKPTYTDECQIVDSYYSMERNLNERGILFDDYMKQECPNKNEMCYKTCPYAYNREFYPPFTTGKQVELIKWLSKRRLLNIAANDDKNTYQLFNNKCTGSFCSDLATAIATLVQCELDFCSEEERNKIYGILRT